MNTTETTASWNVARSSDQLKDFVAARMARLGLTDLDLDA